MAPTLVVGATGDLGGRVVRLLRESGHDVRYLARPASNDTALRGLGAVAVAGELTDPSSLSAACDGMATVVATATAIGRRLAGASRQSVRDVDRNGMLALVDAAERAGVHRFVYMSFAAVDRGLGGPLEVAKTEVENRLKTSRLNAVILRPDAFQEIHLAPMGRFDVQNAKASIFGTGQTKRRFIATEDVAALTAAVVDEEQPPPIIEFGGPEPLSKMEAVGVAERVTGRKMKVQRMPRPLARLAMRALSRRNDALASVFGLGLHMDVVEADWDDSPLLQRGIKPTSPTSYIEAQAG